MPLYPKLSEEQVEVNPEKFRITHIADVKKQLEKDLESYSRTRRKYASAFKHTNYVDSFGNVISVVGGAVSVGLGFSGIGLPISLAVGSVSIAIGGVTAVASFLSKRFVKKLEKHDKISELAGSKLSSINHIVSKAMDDGKISDSEFKLVLDDFEEYKKEKRAIQENARQAISSTSPQEMEELKKKFTEIGKQMAKKEITEKLKNA
jgi:uncharacterized membrane protein YdfJ with MMPL/SSD domain